MRNSHCSGDLDECRGSSGEAPENAPCAAVPRSAAPPGASRKRIGRESDDSPTGHLSGSSAECGTSHPFVPRLATTSRSSGAFPNTEFLADPEIDGASPRNVTVLSASHPQKSETPIFATLLGNTISFRLLHEKKAESPTSDTPSPRSTDTRLRHMEKARGPIFLTLPGSLTRTMFLHAAKAPAPTAVSDPGSRTSGAVLG